MSHHVRDCVFHVQVFLSSMSRHLGVEDLQLSVWTNSSMGLLYQIEHSHLQTDGKLWANQALARLGLDACTPRQLGEGEGRILKLKT